MSYEQLLEEISELDKEHLCMLSTYVESLKSKDTTKKQDLTNFFALRGKVKLDYSIIEKEREISKT